MCTTAEALESLTEFRSMVTEAMEPIASGVVGGGMVKEQKKWFDGLVKRKVSGTKA